MDVCTRPGESGECCILGPDGVSAAAVANVSMVLPQKKSKDHFGLEGDEESTMLEDSVSPKK